MQMSGRYIQKSTIQKRSLRIFAVSACAKFQDHRSVLRRPHHFFSYIAVGQLSRVGNVKGAYIGTLKKVYNRVGDTASTVYTTLH